MKKFFYIFALLLTLASADYLTTTSAYAVEGDRPRCVTDNCGQGGGFFSAIKNWADDHLDFNGDGDACF